MAKNWKTYVCALFFFQKLKKKIIRSVKQELTLKKFFFNLRVYFHVVCQFPKFQQKIFIIVGKNPEKLI